ncbi:glycine--tRNA ligase [Patescibacteria group bacterium]|nr:glycine--tRNA ligase [Patescibacteria group bacterium]
MVSMQEIVSLCKRRGFVYQSSEIYGGLQSVYDYGPLGVELMRNLRDLWWKKFVLDRENIVGIETEIFMHPQVWVSSGHAKGFADPMVEDTKTNKRYRADHIIEEWCLQNKKDIPDCDNMSLEELDKFISENKILSPDKNKLRSAQSFNLMFKTALGSVEDKVSDLYLRAETAQGMYVQFKNVLDSTRVKIPFGIAQQGTVFRNEITKGKFIFRTLEFQQMEIQYFFDGKNWEDMFHNTWRKEIEDWYINELGIKPEKLKWKPHAKLIFYAKAAEDIQYKFPWGFDEVSGLHYRTDYDLDTHMKNSGVDLMYRDPDTNEKFLPHVLEATWGLNRNFLMVLCDAYTVENNRTYLNLSAKLAPYKVAVFPLVRNKENITERAREVFKSLKNEFHSYYDDRGNIGKRYMYQDEIGTPFCVTVDYETLENGTVTVRDRDTTVQERVPVAELVNWIKRKIENYK